MIYNKIFLDLYLAKFLDTSAKLFFSICVMIALAKATVVFNILKNRSFLDTLENAKLMTRAFGVARPRRYDSQNRKRLAPRLRYD